MVKQFSSSTISRNRVFTDHGVPDGRIFPVDCRTAEEARGSIAYTHADQAHDPCPKFELGKVLADIRRCCHAEVSSQAESWIFSNSDSFIRAPKIYAPSPWIVALTWRYDGHVVHVRFRRDGVWLNQRKSTRGHALDAVLAWNATLIRGEMARIRAAGLPPGPRVTVDSLLTCDEDGW